MQLDSFHNAEQHVKHSSTTKKNSVPSVPFFLFPLSFGLVFFSKGNFIMWNVQSDKFCTQSSPLFPIQPYSFQRSAPIPQGCSSQASQTFCFGTITLEIWVTKPRAALWSHTSCCFEIFKTAVLCFQNVDLAEKEETFRTFATSQTDLLPLARFAEKLPKQGGAAQSSFDPTLGCCQKMSWNMCDTICNLQDLPAHSNKFYMVHWPNSPLAYVKEHF